MERSRQHGLHDLVLHHRVQLEEAGGGVQVLHVRVLHIQILHVQVSERCCDRGHGWRWVQCRLDSEPLKVTLGSYVFL